MADFVVRVLNGSYWSGRDEVVGDAKPSERNLTRSSLLMH
jgi:hypothetical protein